MEVPEQIDWGDYSDRDTKKSWEDLQQRLKRQKSIQSERQCFGKQWQDSGLKNVFFSLSMKFGGTGVIITWVFVKCLCGQKKKSRDTCQRSCLIGHLTPWIICHTNFGKPIKSIVLGLFNKLCTSLIWHCPITHSFMRMRLRDTWWRIRNMRKRFDSVKLSVQFFKVTLLTERSYSAKSGLQHQTKRKKFKWKPILLSNKRWPKSQQIFLRLNLGLP